MQPNNVLANIRLDKAPRPKTPRVYETLIISEADLRRRIASIKAIFKDPREETARLKAIAAERGIKTIKLAGLRPLDLLIAPSTDDMQIVETHGASPRKAGLGPPSRAPPFAIPAGQGPPLYVANLLERIQTGGACARPWSLRTVS